jgi:hypothetical protein
LSKPFFKEGSGHRAIFERRGRCRTGNISVTTCCFTNFSTAIREGLAAPNGLDGIDREVAEQSGETAPEDRLSRYSRLALTPIPELF